MKKILVIGAGAWGSAIANLLAKNSYKVFLTANNSKIVEEINLQKTNQKFLPQVKFLSNVEAILDFSKVISEIDLVFIVVPSAACKEVFDQISKLNLNKKIKKTCGFIICSKGFDRDSLKVLSDVFEEKSKLKKYAILSGPNFAIEVAIELPTITTIASRNKKFAQEVIKVLNNKNFRADYFKDPRTAEICGIMKNILAIGCGIVDGLELGVNAKSALIMKGISEIRLLCRKLKISDDLISAAGFGDIFLTCSSSKSRNNWLGSEIAKGFSYQEIIEKTSKTFEGYYSSKNIDLLCKKLKINLELCQAINEILYSKASRQEISKKIIKAILI